MSTQALAAPAVRSSAARAILWGGGIAGLCDITYAIGYSYYRGVMPARVLQSVASGLLGSDAFNGGLPVAALGLLLHFVIAFGAATTFYFASRKLTFLSRQPLLYGPIFGVLVYFFMNLVVIPLSNVPVAMHAHLSGMPLVRGLLIHMFGIGLPIALATNRAHRV